MCGVIGVLSKETGVRDKVLAGLKRLEYRGYDSAGIAVVHNGTMEVRKAAGRISELESLLDEGFDGTLAIGHTRWATHGAPTSENAHPHVNSTGEFAVIHNGIIENYAVLREQLVKEGYEFTSETDTEVIAHLIARNYMGSDLAAAVRKTLMDIEGTYGIVVISSRNPGTMIAAKLGSPMLIGIGENDTFAASDAAAIIAHTKQVIRLEDYEMAEITAEGFRTYSLRTQPVDKTVETIEWDLERIEKGNYPHFMLKEIFEQPESIRNCCRGRLRPETGDIHLGGVGAHLDQLRDTERIIIVAAGTSRHAGMIGEYLFEEYAHIPTEVEHAAEFRYRNPIIREGDVVIVLSQSGETSDTHAALLEAKRRGALTVGICNVVGSSIAQDTDCGIYVHAGPEIGVASTKAFTCQVTALTMLAIMVGRTRELSAEDAMELAQHLAKIPEQVESILARSDEIKRIADLYAERTNALFLGRSYYYPVALEGALKLKEISYIHAEGYPAAEMKHGPIALIDENMPVVFVAPRDAVYDKIVSNIQETRARQGMVIAIATEGDDTIQDLANHVLYIPRTLDALGPILAVIPLQLLAYYIADARGLDPDKPRNLAKSVTVE